MPPKWPKTPQKCPENAFELPVLADNGNSTLTPRETPERWSIDENICTQ